MVTRCGRCGKTYSDSDAAYSCCSTFTDSISSSIGPKTKEPPAPDFDIEKAVKADDDKADLSLLSYNALILIAKAFEFGAKKYGRYNYLKGMEWTRITSALLRHTFAFIWGEDNDKESGLPHPAHIGACCIMLLDYFTLGLGTDNRYKK